MKLYKLKLFNGVNTEETEVKAEAHTFDNGMILFWTKNSEDQWAMVAAYPTSVTAITFYDEDKPPKVSQIPDETYELISTLTEPVKKGRKK